MSKTLQYARLLVRDSSLAALAGSAARAFVFAASLLVSRHADSSARFGAYSSALLIAQLAGAIASFGLSQAATQAIARASTDPFHQQQCASSMSRLIVGAAGLAALVIIVAGELLPHLWRLPTSTFAWSAALCFFHLSASGLEGVLRGFRLFRVLPIGTAIACLAAVPIGALLLPADAVAGGLAMVFTFYATQFLVYLWSLGPRALGRPMPRASLKPLLSGIAAPAFLASLSFNVAMFVPPLLLLRRDAGLSDIGAWNAATQLRTVLSFAPLIICQAAIPHVASLHARGSLSRGRALASIALPLALAFALFTPALILIEPLTALYGPVLTGYSALCRLVLGYVFLQILGSVAYAFVLATNWGIWACAWLNVAWCATVLFFAIAATNKGAVALATLYVQSYIPVLATQVYIGVRALRRATCERLSTPTGELLSGSAE